MEHTKILMSIPDYQKFRGVNYKKIIPNKDRETAKKGFVGSYENFDIYVVRSYRFDAALRLKS